MTFTLRNGEDNYTVLTQQMNFSSGQVLDLPKGFTISGFLNSLVGAPRGALILVAERAIGEAVPAVLRT